MTDHSAAIAELRRRHSAAQQQRMRAEAELDAAKAAAERALADLTREFAVSTPAEARALLTDLEHRLTEEITTLSQALDAMGA